ncbi:transcription factor bHLH146 [Argentina anserina]|uniref:transcription factor bHLH146 n=1 Tax=Argentina anserina TaxID=57926 RepID=UPI0021767433|nr:transcription factor bHLH146 [Potentilla anserina]
MGKQQKRVYSLQANRSVCSSVFARRYVNYLLPALKKNKENEECSNSDVHELEKIIGYQVNMAMVLSASTQREFAWMRALKQNLETNCVNGKRFSLPHPRVSKPLSFLRNPRCSASNNKMKNYCSSNMSKRVRPNFRARTTLTIKKIEKKDEEAEMISTKMVSLRRLLPGGSEMVDDELLEEVGSYVTCLQLQVTILRRLVGSIEDVD